MSVRATKEERRGPVDVGNTQTSPMASCLRGSEFGTFFGEESETWGAKFHVGGMANLNRSAPGKPLLYYIHQLGPELKTRQYITRLFTWKTISERIAKTGSLHTSKYTHVRESTANVSWNSPPISHLHFTRWNAEFQQGNRDCKWKLLWIISATFQGSCFDVPQVEPWQWQMVKQLASLKLFSLVLVFPPQCSPWILPWRIPTPLARRGANQERQRCGQTYVVSC